MVASGMRRYLGRDQDLQHLLIPNQGPIDPQQLFARRARLRLEIGFGHGHFLSQMAAAHPAEDFLGVEALPIRVSKTAHWSDKRHAQNVRLACAEAERFLRERIPNALLHRVYILFPDPWPKAKHRRRRLINRRFLQQLTRTTVPGGRFIFASDTHNYAMQVLSQMSTLEPGLWRNCYLNDGGYRFNILTRFPTIFEQHHKALGHDIAYLMFERSEAPYPEGQ